MIDAGNGGAWRCVVVHGVKWGCIAVNGGVWSGYRIPLLLRTFLLVLCDATRH